MKRFEGKAVSVQRGKTNFRMTIRLFSLGYFFFPIVFAFLFFLFLWFFKDKSKLQREVFIFILAAINVFQHLFKRLLFGFQYSRFGLENTAYNMCSFLIITMPFALVKKGGTYKIFSAFIGTAAGLIAMLIPYWFWGKSVFEVESIRFYVCHGLLFLTGALQIAFKSINVDYKNCFVIPLWFFFALGFVILDIVVYYRMKGLKDAFWIAYGLNPVYSMHPPENLWRIVKVVAHISPTVFIQYKIGAFLPFWYFFPMYFIITGYSLLMTYTLKSKSKKGNFPIQVLLN